MGESSKSDMDNTPIDEDPSQFQITTMKFNGYNYLMWSKLVVIIYIQGKDKEEYLASENEISPKSNPCTESGRQKNAMVEFCDG